MKKAFVGKALAVLAAVVVIGACAGTQPIYNVANTPFPTGGKSLSMDEAQKAIIRAGTRLGWQMQPTRSGLISGRIALRTHVAMIDVEHDTRTFSIKYKDSTGLNAQGDMIHKNYNGWIQNLEKAIRTELIQ